MSVAHTHNTHQVADEETDIGAKGDCLAAEIFVVACCGLATHAADTSLDDELGDQAWYVTWRKLGKRNVFLVAVMGGNTLERTAALTLVRSGTATSVVTAAAGGMGRR